MRSGGIIRATLALFFGLTVLVFISSASARPAAVHHSRQIILHVEQGSKLETSFLNSLHVRLLHRLPDKETLVLRLTKGGSLSRALKGLRQLPQVLSAALDTPVKVSYTPDDPLYQSNASPCTSTVDCWPYGNLNLPGAWDATTGSSAVTIAVVDTGVDANHPDLSGAVLQGYNFVAGSTNTSDDNGHGTEVSGVIAARINNGIGVPGVCGKCSILPVKVLNASGSGSTATVAQGIEWAADHGAKIINLSLAGNADPAFETAISYANSKGALVIAAAGNAGSSSPNSCGYGACGGYPAAYAPNYSSGLISVGAVDYYNNLYYFSNHGSWVMVAAPGCANTTTFDGSYGSACGTSIATPFISGLAGLALSYNPSLNVAALQQAITSSATAKSGLDVEDGIIDAQQLMYNVGYKPPAPTNTTLPVLSGTVSVGKSLSTTTGSWTGSPSSYSYQWQRCDATGANCADIASATSSSYTISIADEGDTLRAAVTATNSGGGTTANTAVSTAVPLPPSNITLPTITGTDLVGQQLNASTGTWANSPTSYGYQWWRCDASGGNCASINGAMGSSYTVSADDESSTLDVIVTAINSSGSSQARSAATGLVPAPPQNTALPQLSGSASIGQTLHVDNGSWSGTPTITYSYQWQRCDTTGSSCSDIGGETASSYTAAVADFGSTVRAVVTASNAGGEASATTAPSAVIVGGPKNTVPPTITGVVKSGNTLTISRGTWASTAGTISYSYQWQRCDENGTNCSSISGATATTYRLTTTDETSTIAASVTASDQQGHTTVMTAPTSVVPQPPTNTALPAITGTVLVGQTLTASAGSWSGTATITYSYQWQDCNGTRCSAVKGLPAQNTFTIRSSDANDTVRVVVTATNNGGDSTAASATTVAVPAPPSITSPPRLTGKSVLGQQFTVTSGAWRGTQPMIYSYQWQRCSTAQSNSCSTIDAANGTTYTATDSDVGFRLRVLVTATNAGGSASAPSAMSGAIVADPVNVSLPTVVGKIGFGQTLTAAPGTWTGTAPISYRYQWQSCGTGIIIAGGSESYLCSNISGAASANYTPKAFGFFRVVVTATNSAGTASANSAMVYIHPVLPIK